MRLSDVLAQVDGLNKRFVYYLEAQGHISPTKIRKARISRRDYSAEDLATIHDLWSYYRRGYTIQGARELVERSGALAAYVLFAVPSRRWREAIDLLAECEKVGEAALVHGESANAIVRIAAPDDHEIWAVLNQVFDHVGIEGIPRILKLDREGAFRRSGLDHERLGADGSAPSKAAMQAYLLIKVPAKHAGGVLEQLREFPGVAEASMVYGETDIVARVEAGDQESLDDLIINEIQGLPAVESTRTFVVVSKQHWRR